MNSKKYSEALKSLNDSTSAIVEENVKYHSPRILLRKNNPRVVLKKLSPVEDNQSNNSRKLRSSKVNKISSCNNSIEDTASVSKNTSKKLKKKPCKFPRNGTKSISDRENAVPKIVSNNCENDLRRSSKHTEVLHSPIRKSPRKLHCDRSPSHLLNKLNINSGNSFQRKLNLSENGIQQELEGYRALKASLSCSNKEVVGREAQIDSVKEFISTHLKNKTSGSVYISGAPGTGKTATVTKILEEVETIKFTKIFINCMSTSTSRDIFSAISKEMKVLPGRNERESIDKIEYHITQSKLPILICLDEMDRLGKKNQNALYTIFEWPSLHNSKVVLVGVANMLDLTDRILLRLQSNPSTTPKLLHFPAYTKSEIVHIINDRIKQTGAVGDGIIKASVVQFVAAKVSAIAGDARKALDVCRRAVELVELDARRNRKSTHGEPITSGDSQSKKVDIPLVLSIFNGVYGCRVAKDLSSGQHAFTLQQKIVLCTLLLVNKQGKFKHITLGKLNEAYSKVCARQKIPGVEQNEFASLCEVLESRGVLHLKKSPELRNSKVQLNINEDDLKSTLNDNYLLSSIVEDKDFSI